MKFLVVLCLVGLATSARLPGYNYPTPDGGTFGHGSPGHTSGITVSHDDSSGTFGQGISTGTVVSHGSTSGVTLGQGVTTGTTVSHGTSSGTFAHGTTSGTTVSHGTSSLGSTSVTIGNIGGVSGTVGLSPCVGDQVRHVDGRCVTPRVNRRVFLYDVPANVHTTGPINIPEPRVETNILLIRTPEGGLGDQPIVLPPPRQNNVVYILNKQSTFGPGVIEVPSAPLEEPEVYFVNYAEGENPILPNGQDLQSALLTASQASGQTIGSVGHTGSISGQVFDDHSSAVGISHTISSGGLSTSDGGQIIGSVGQTSSVGGQTFGSLSQTSSVGGQTFGSVGQTSGVGGQTFGSVGQTSIVGGQTFGSVGQTSSVGGQTFGSVGQTSTVGGGVHGTVIQTTSGGGSTLQDVPLTSLYSLP
ncbi:uncharacterized protein [Penaeus vannamei]|uniref:uncharacterized protein n=1 Tax=Penaeus vannamei TaxID=6689 RepID=UPI00387F5BC5